jgi:hypothetical protein
VWSLIFFILELSLEAPFAVRTLSNRFGFATIGETMEYSDEDSDYSQASNEVNIGNKNSPSHNVVDVSADTNGSESNDITIGVIGQSRSEPYTNLPICAIVFLLIVVFLLFSLL